MDLSFLLVILGMVAIMYLMIYRPNKKQREEHQKRMESLRPNDKVITVGGVHGTISRVKDTTVLLKVSDRTEIEFSKDAIRTIVDPNEPGAAKKQVQEFDDDDEDFLTDEEIAEKRKRKKLKKGAQSGKKDTPRDENKGEGDGQEEVSGLSH
jgi:preprotein translocase subunit YajC